MADPQALHRSDLPPMYQAASDRAQSAQRTFLFGMSVALMMLLVGAVAGLFVVKEGPADWAGVVALGAFLVAVIVRAHRLIIRPDKIWYQGRSIAEQVKSEAWRYAVGGAPYSPPAEPGAGTLFATALGDILEKADQFPFKAPQETKGQVSNAMAALRAAPLATRKSTYVTGRLLNQQKYYAKRERTNRRARQAWNGVLFVLEIGGMGAGLAKALGLLEIDLLGLAGTAAGAGTSWLQMRQHAALEQRYGYTAQQLAILQGRLGDLTNESAWATFVADVENVLNEEHRQWLASRLK